MKKLFALALIALAVLVSAGCGGSSKAGPVEVAGIWVQALHDNNFGIGCSMLTAKNRAGLPVRTCSINYVDNIGFAITSGFDPFKSAELLKEPDGSVKVSYAANGTAKVYVIDCSGNIGSATISLVKDKEGNWLIDSVDAWSGPYGATGEKAPQCKGGGAA